MPEHLGVKRPRHVLPLQDETILLAHRDAARQKQGESEGSAPCTSGELTEGDVRGWRGSGHKIGEERLEGNRTGSAVNKQSRFKGACYQKRATPENQATKKPAAMIADQKGSQNSRTIL